MSREPNQQFVKFTERFENGTREDWTRLVEESLQGKSVDNLFGRCTYEGFELQPIYSGGVVEGDVSQEGFVTSISEIRERAAAFPSHSSWNVCQYYSYPDPQKVNEELQNDIDGGVDAISILFNCNMKGSTDEGVAIRSLSDLETLFNGVDLTEKRVSLHAERFALPLSSMFAAYIQTSSIDPDSISGNFGVDPLGTLAKGGALLGKLKEQMEGGAELADWAAKNFPKLRTFLVDTSIYYEGGVTETEDLAIAISTALEYLRSMEANGIALEEALTQVSFNISVGTDVFQNISKLRALRVLWDRVVENCDQSKKIGNPVINANISKRVLSGRDLSVNLLRSTCACFSSVVGGADSVTLLPHTHLIGYPSETDRRMTRNIQNVLMHESFIANVADPAGGAFYVESLTNDFSRRSWEIFQNIEEKGGISEMLLAGEIQLMAKRSWETREKNLANCTDLITGVSSFPDLTENLPSVRPKEDTTQTEISQDTWFRDSSVSLESFDNLVKMAADGAYISTLAKLFGVIEHACEPIKTHRYSESFESLRDKSDVWLRKKGRRPLALIARLGSPSDYTARVVFAKSYLAAGGIDSLEMDIEPKSGANILESTRAQLLVICSSDQLYRENLESVLRSVRSSSGKPILLAYSPGIQESELRGLGIDKFIFPGDPMLDTLFEVADSIGMNSL